MRKALFILEDIVREMVYPPPLIDAVGDMVDMYAPPQSPDVIEQNPDVLQDMEFLFSSWTCPTIDEKFLELAPNLKVVFYGAGSIKNVVTDAFWHRGVRITHAANANNVIVAQFTLGQIILSLKGVWSQVNQTRDARTFVQARGFGGLRESTVGIIGLGLIGRHVCELLKPFDVEILAYDPYVDEDVATALGVRLVDLGTIFADSHIVSLHAPWTPETEGMIRGEHFASMRPNATFINTARGALVREDEMIAVLRERDDLFALLDVTHPEPPVTDSPLYELPNIILTPHIAGAIEPNETRTMGELMVNELRHYLNNDKLQWEVTKDRLATMA